MKKGINQWSFSDQLSLKEQIKLAKEAGFDGFELCVAEEGLFSLSSTDEELEEIKSTAESLDLELPSLATDLLWKYPLSSEDSRVRTKGIEITKKMISFASKLGADTILVIPGIVENPFDPQSELIPYDQAYNRIVKILKDLAKSAKEERVTVGIENVWNKFLLSPLEIRDLIDQVGSDYVQVYLDVGNVLQFGYPEHWIQILGDRICKVHVKDFKKNIGNIRGFTYLLQGDVNWPQVISSLDQIGYDDYLTAEVLPPYQTYPEKLIYDTSSSLDKILKEGICP